MATVHLYEDGREVCGRTLILKRHVNIESVESWWRACRKALTGKEVPLEYTKVEVDPAWIRFELSGGRLVVVDRKRALI